MCFLFVLLMSYYPLDFCPFHSILDSLVIESISVFILLVVTQSKTCIFDLSSTVSYYFYSLLR